MILPQRETKDRFFCNLYIAYESTDLESKVGNPVTAQCRKSQGYVTASNWQGHCANFNVAWQKYVHCTNLRRIPDTSVGITNFGGTNYNKLTTTSISDQTEEKA